MTEHTLYQKMIKGVFFTCAYYDKVYTADKRIRTGQTKIKTKNGNLFYLPYCHIREMRSNNFPIRAGVKHLILGKNVISTT